MSEQLTREMLQQLREPLPASKISFKVQTKPSEKGNALVVAYIDARDVMDILDRVVGPDWSTRYEWQGEKAVMCYLTVAGVTRADVSGVDNDNEPVKSAISDAFKRAAVHFGVGRFLYDLPKMWAQVKPAGKTFILADGELEKLQRQVDAHLKGNRSAAVRSPHGSAAEKPVSAAQAPSSGAPSSSELRRQHAELWLKAGGAHLLNKENVAAWNITPASTEQDILAKIRQIEAVLQGAAAPTR